MVLLLISEVLFDPDPPVGLPSFEYAELFNPGPDTVDLAGWQWFAGGKVRPLPGGSIAPGGYAVVTSAAGAPAFRPFGQVLVVESFPALRNSGDRLAIINPDGIAVHTIEYSPVQFADALKANGGWALELADLQNHCSSAAWLPSTDPSGGTPGRANSQQLSIPAGEPARLLRAAGYDAGRFVLLFSGPLDPAVDVNNYAVTINPGGLQPAQAPAGEFGFPGLFINYPDMAAADTIYTINITGTVTDCSLRPSLLRPLPFGLPSAPDSADVVITEILFDPLPGQTEFVELFNRSERVVELRDLLVARADTTGLVTGWSDSQPLSFWLFPGCYAVIPADEALLRSGWPGMDPALLAARTDLPALTNGESRLLLLNRGQQVIDAITWSPEWHYPFLSETRGVSLERLDPALPGVLRSSWFSASADVGGSTPGAPNSCRSPPETGTDDRFTLQPAAGFTSANGVTRQVGITYRFGEAGWFLRIQVFDRSGVSIRELFPFGAAGPEGMAAWDGLDDAQCAVPDGIYLLVADYYHPSGSRGRWRRACAFSRD
jgi:hypothetical protein